MSTHPTINALTRFQLERLRRALLSERVAATPRMRHLAVRCVYSLYRSCVELGAKAQADELCAQMRHLRAYDQQEKPIV